MTELRNGPRLPRPRGRAYTLALLLSIVLALETEELPSVGAGCVPAAPAAAPVAGPPATGAATSRPRSGA
jgi:hypothetical protein